VFDKGAAAMALKIVGIILILFGCFGLYEAAHAVSQGSIIPMESASNYPIKRGEPEFDREVATRRIGGITLIGIGIACLFIKKGQRR
jgi:hypothetical protein